MPNLDDPSCLYPFCILCGVQFNIGRIRTQEEPAEEGYGWSHVDGESEPTACGLPPYDCKYIHIQNPHKNEQVVANPGEQYDMGYNGYNITNDEMRWITSSLQIHLKTTHISFVEMASLSMAADEINEFELESETFMTRVSILPPDVLSNGHEASCDFYYVRTTSPWLEGTVGSFVTNDFRNEVARIVCGVAFHPECFEIFKRVSMEKLGKVDIDGLYWLAHDKSGREGLPIFRGFDVDDCTQTGNRNWKNLIGTEYLAANPVEIPGLSEILADITRERYMGPNRRILPPKPPHSTDPFHRLPQELRDIIVSHLPPSSVLSLRLCSRSFSRLPYNYFEELLLQEMPYMWEIFDSDHIEYIFRDKNIGKILNPPKTPEQRKGAIEISKDRRTIDWFKLYRTLKCRLIPLIKGLKNRKRIWRDVEEILSMMNRSWRNEINS